MAMRDRLGHIHLYVLFSRMAIVLAWASVPIAIWGVELRKRSPKFERYQAECSDAIRRANPELDMGPSEFVSQILVNSWIFMGLFFIIAAFALTRSLLMAIEIAHPRRRTIFGKYVLLSYFGACLYLCLMLISYSVQNIKYSFIVIALSQSFLVFSIMGSLAALAARVGINAGEQEKGGGQE